MDVGDRIRVKTKDAAYEGALMPRPDLFGDDFLVLKLDTGYNMGIRRSNIIESAILESYKGEQEPKKAYEPKKGLKRVSILHTGGTIASKVDYRTGGVVAAFSPEELIAMFPDLSRIANIDSKLIVNMWSDDLRFAHLKLIAETISEKVKEGTEGIIIGMGTDNLAVASAAMEFIIERTPVPIIFVGSQRSSDRGSSDAAMNLACAAAFITNTDFGGVAICMHENTDDDSCVILPAAKTKKLHSSRRDAFKAVNSSPYARVNYLTKKIEILGPLPGQSRELHMRPDMEEKVGLMKISINMFPEQFLVYKGWKGLVLEGTGLGHAPIHIPNELTKLHADIERALKEVVDSGCVVVMTTGCIFGRVGMNVYSKGRDLQKIGVIPGEDMLAETAFVKLSWLLGNYPAQEAKKLVKENLRGEINERILPDEFL